MVFGILLILFGVLIALFPQILVAIIATILIFSGTMVCVMSWRMKRFKRDSAGVFQQWIGRF